MKTVKFIPKFVTGYTDKVKDAAGNETEVKREPTFKGCITLKVPNYFERQKFKSILMGAITQGGETTIEAVRESSKRAGLSDVMSKMAEIVELSIPFYQAVELENIATGMFHKSFEDMSLDAGAEGILMEVAQELSSGLALSKNS